MHHSKRRLTSLLLGTLASAFSAPHALAADRGCVPVVRDAWIRMPRIAMPMLAGFARIDNGCANAAVIVGASSPAFGSVELHESTLVDGISRMRAVPRLPVGSHSSRQMKPGGLHLMLMQPRVMPKPGVKLRVDFQLSDGRTLHGEFEVRPADAR